MRQLLLSWIERNQKNFITDIVAVLQDTQKLAHENEYATTSVTK